MHKYTKILAVFITIFACIFTINVKALETGSGNFPDLPEGLENAIIIEYNNTYTLYGLEDSGSYDSWIFTANGWLNPYNSATETSGSGSGAAYYGVENGEWEYYGHQQPVAEANSLDYVAYSSVDIYQTNGEKIANSGYGLPLSNLFTNALAVITAILGFLVTVTTNLLSNDIFKMVIGIIVLYIAISTLYGMAAKPGKNTYISKPRKYKGKYINQMSTKELKAYRKYESKRMGM